MALQQLGESGSCLAFALRLNGVCLLAVVSSSNAARFACIASLESSCTELSDTAVAIFAVVLSLHNRAGPKSGLHTVGWFHWRVERRKEEGSAVGCAGAGAVIVGVGGAAVVAAGA